MTKTIHLTYWDSCVFLSFLENTPGRAATIELLFDEVRRAPRERRIITSTLSIAEVSYLSNADADPSDESRIDTLWGNTTVVGLVEMHEGIARRARALIRQARALGLTLRGADAVHLATSAQMAANAFFTYDHKLLRLDGQNLIPCPICEPFVTNPRLPLL